ncbi:MAG: recombination regulator RecX [Granulosicoccus sp.]|nr:recombination regulator RecX [Granulosicoccus sp.]
MENDQNDSDDESYRQVYSAGIRLLAVRGHSVLELQQKLSRKQHALPLIDRVISDLLNAGYLDDQNFAYDYSRQRIAKGYGPLAIRQGLFHRGVEARHIEQALNDQNINWLEHAQTVISNRFEPDAIISAEPKIEARIARFMQHRGFTGSDSLRALQVLRKRISSLAD